MRKGSVKTKCLTKSGGVGRPGAQIEIQDNADRGGASVGGRPARNAGPSEFSIEGILRPRRDTYAEKVIDDPRRFDAIEVHDTCQLSDLDGPSYEEPDCDRVAPLAFSVYAHLSDGGVDCCGDFSQRSDALAYGRELAAIHHWPMFDYISSTRRGSSEALCRDALLTMAFALRAGCLHALEPLDLSVGDDQSAIKAVLGVYARGLTDIRRQMETSKDWVPSRVGIANGE